MYKNNKQEFSLVNESQEGRRGFSLIELIVVIAIIGVLVMLASPRFLGRTKEATLAKHLYNVKTLEDTMDRYVLENDRFPRLSEEAYTSEQVEEYANRIRDLTGEEITLDPEGKYYDIDYVTLRDYVKVPDKRDMPNYILQNPVGKVFFLEELTEVANDRADFTANNPMNDKVNSGKQPVAVISGLPGGIITKDTQLNFQFQNSKTSEGKELIEQEWKNKKSYYKVGEHTVSLRVKDSAGLWSLWIDLTFHVVDVPGKPSSLRVDGNRIYSDKANIIRWNGVSDWGEAGDSKNYKLEYRYNKVGDFELLSNTGTATEYVHQLPLLKSVKNIEYRVSAENGIASSILEYSSVFSVIAPSFESFKRKSSDTNYTVKEDGIYQVVIKGGDGGLGGNQENGSTPTIYGGRGGSGSTIGGYIELKKGDRLRVTHGEDGVQGGRGNNFASASGGSGGQVTLLSLNGVIVARAKGGNGGKGADKGIRYGLPGKPGEGTNYFIGKPGTTSLSAGEFVIRRWYDDELD